MTREEAKKYLDTVATAIHTLIDIDNQNGISICTMNPEFHIFSGIFQLSEALELPLQREWRNDSSYPIELSFTYEGVKFYELCKIKTRKPDDIYSVELELSDKEKVPFDDSDETPEIFKGMQKAVDDFDSATSNIHAELGSLGVVE